MNYSVMSEQLPIFMSEALGWYLSVLDGHLVLIVSKNSAERPSSPGGSLTHGVIIRLISCARHNSFIQTGFSEKRLRHMCTGPEEK